jgi:spermidine/putrescine ABC transporter ATP-binding subunit
MSGSRVLVAVRRVRRTYDSVVAVNDVSLDILEGEFLTLLGPSGSGKTTTLMMIAGFERPDRGEILLRGESMTARPPEKRDIGMVFQNYALFPHLSVFDNVAFPLRMRRTPRAQVAGLVQGALRAVHLPGLDARYPRQLSGGQQQRVALARALVYRPSLLLMDEPLGALDRKLREEMQAELKSIQRELGVTTLYVTHDQQEALTLSDRIAVMNRGDVVQVGRPLELYERPTDVFIAGFLGDVNFLDGVVVGREGGTATVEVADGVRVTAAVTVPPPLGKRVGLSIRPERLRMNEPAGEGVSLGAGTIRDVTFLGDLLRYSVVLAGGLALKVTRQFVGERAVLDAGVAITVAADPGDWRLYE